MRVLVAACSVAVLASSCSSGVSVQRTTVGVRPVSSSPGCPKTFRFTGEIAARGRGRVSYRWERSDTPPGPVHTVHFAAAGTATVDDLRTFQTSADGWQVLHILRPYDRRSARASFSVACTPGVIAVAAGVSPQVSRACTQRFVFTGHVTAGGPLEVTYRWARSDGSLGSVQTLRFAAAGTLTSTFAWVVAAAPYAGWAELRVLAPTGPAPARAPFRKSAPCIR